MAVTGYGSPVVDYSSMLAPNMIPGPPPDMSGRKHLPTDPLGVNTGDPFSTTRDIQGSLIHNMTQDLFPVPGEPLPQSVPAIGLWPGYNPTNVQEYRNAYWANPANYPAPTPTPPATFPGGPQAKANYEASQQQQPQSQGLSFPTLRPPAPLPQPGLLINGQPNPGAHVTNFQTGPSAPTTFDPAAQFNNQTPAPPLPGLNTSGTNPYLNDPLMSSYYGMQNPLYANQGQQDFYGDPELFSAPSAASATKG